MTTQPTRKNRVFVSYSWDSAEHMARVLALASHLRKNGFDARLDQWESLAPIDGWPAWCSRQVLRADWIVMVCTRDYFERFHGMTRPSIPCGVQWESRTIQNRAYYHTLRAGFVPLVFSGSGAEFVPPVALGNAVPIQWPKDDAWDTSEILNRLVPEGDRQGWPALEIPVAKADAAAIPTAPADVFGPSVITDDIMSRLLKIDDRIEAFAKAYQDRHNPPGLIPDDYSWQSSASQDPSFAELRYDQRWLEYRPSPDAEARIERFLNDPRDWLWWGVVAPGGVGKSRFGLELIKKAHGRGWDVAFSNDSSETKWLEEDHKGWRPRKPTLLVYDYANFRGQKIIQVLKGLRDSLRNKYFPPVRILLLDRPGGIGQPPGDITTGWETTWRNVREALYVEPRPAASITDKGRGAFTRPASQTDRRPLARDDELLRLELPARADWPGILADTVQAATGGSPSLTFPPLSDTNWWDKVDRLTHSGRMLHLQLLGIVMARAGNVSIEWISNEKGRHDLLDEMLEYERKHRWVLLCVPKMRGEESEILANPRFKSLIKAAGFVTLNRGLSLGTDEEKLLIDTTGVEARDFSILRNILRYRDDLADPDKSDATIERFEPLEPDLLGEWLLIKLIQPFFSKQDERERLSTHCRLNMDPADFVTASIRTNPLGLAQTLRLMVDDFPSDPSTLRWFCAVLEAFASVSLADEKTNLAIGQARFEAAQAVSRFSMQQTDDTGWKDAYDRFARKAPLKLLIGFSEQAESGCATDPSRMWHRQFLELAASTVRVSDSSFATFIDHLAAQVAIVAINHYGWAGRFDELERWGEVVAAAVARFPADAAIGLEQAQAGFNAITVNGSAGRFDELERWGEVVAAAVARFPADAAIGLEQAKAAYNAITDYRKAGRFDELERWGKVVAAAVARFPADAEIGLVQAKAAYNAITDYGKAGRFDELERWGEVVDAVVARFPADAEIGLVQARAAFDAISLYGQAGRFDELERWTWVLAAVVARFPADAAIGLKQAQAAYNSISLYCQAGRSDELERWGEVLAAAVARFPADAEIGLMQAQAAFNAINYYGQAGRFDELERWSWVLAAAVARFPADGAIGLRQAQAAFNAINHYGSAGRFDGFERWCATYESALARSDLTPELFVQALGMTIHLHNPNTPVTAAPFMAVARYWPGYVVNTANGNAVLCQFMAKIDQAASDLHLSRLARTYEIYEAFARNQFASIEAAQAAMRELWPLRMYLPDRGDGLVPLLGQLGLDDLVAEAARDPWRRASEKLTES